MIDRWVHDTAQIEAGVTIGPNTYIWHYSHLRNGVKLGADVIVGRGVFIDQNVVVGDRVKIQNNALIYSPAEIESGAFIGPGVILTNDNYPRSVNSDFSKKLSEDWSKEGVTIRRGASVGAGVICVAPVVIGAWSLVGAGSVVIKDVPDFALVIGNPARFLKWVGRAGFPLIKVSRRNFVCPSTGEKYRLIKKNMLSLG